MARSRSLGQRVARDGVRLAGSGVTVRQETGALLDSMSEREFQAMILAGLRQRGWICWTVPNMRQTTAGLPDILAIHVRHDVLVAWELKTETGRPTPTQRAVLAVLANVPGIDARIVRPSTWPLLRDALDRPDVAAELARIEEGRV